jgi:hypothetical protein
MIESYLHKYAVLDDPAADSADHRALREIHKQVLSLLAEGDKLASKIRAGQSTSANSAASEKPQPPTALGG